MAFLAILALWKKRSGEPHHTTDDLHADCVEDLYKSVMVRKIVRSLPAAALVAGVVAACSGGLSRGDADLRCNQEQEAKAACFDADVYQLCQSCYERCGDACVPQGLCPEQYLCPGDRPLDAGSDAL